MLGGTPSLKELDCFSNQYMSGNLSSLRVFKDTLEAVKVYDCRRIEGNFMDMADFPRLKELDLRATNVTGDIRDMTGNDFPSLGSLFLPKSILGGYAYEFQNVSDMPSFIQRI